MNTYQDVSDEDYNLYQQYVNRDLDETFGTDRPDYSSGHLQMCIREGLTLEEAADEAILWMSEEIALNT